MRRLQSGGPFTVADARAAGVSPDRIRNRVTTGQWVRLRRGVLAERRLLELTVDPTARVALDVAAAVLALDGRVAASHETAARLLGLESYAPLPDRVVVTQEGRPRRTPARREGVLVRTAALPAEQVTQVRDVPVTVPARTVVDLARTWPLLHGVVLADSARRRTGTSLDELQEMVTACRGWPGSKRAAQVVAASDARAESVLESVVRMGCHELRLPPPATQMWIYDEHGLIGRVDFLWEELQTVVEADGLFKYDELPRLPGQPPLREGTSLREEKLRQERLEEAGLAVVRATYQQTTRELPRTGGRIRAAFARGPLLDRRFLAAPNPLTRAEVAAMRTQLWCRRRAG